MALRILAVGKKHEPWVREGILRYEKRLRRPYDLTWELVPHSAHEASRARQEESERIRNRLREDEYVVLLDERGKLVDSPTLSGQIESVFALSRPITFVVGGAYGVDEAMHARADFVWSLSPLVFPHQMVRLILAEQLYRASEIAAGRPYHHE